MRRDNVFWGGLLVLLGLLFLLQAQGLLRADVFRYFWPLFLILLGGWIILGVYWRPASQSDETFSIPLGGARQAGLKFSNGVGQVEITGGAPAGQLLVGPSARGMNHSSHLVGDKLEAKVEAGPSFAPFVGPASGIWRFQLTQEVPLTLRIEAGANQLNVDLKDVLATYIQLKTGASSTHLTLPARGASLLDVEAGMASIDIRLPEGVAGRIRVKEGATALNVDMNRFPRLEGGIYQSVDFDKAENRAEVNLEAGFGAVTIK